MLLNKMSRLGVILLCITGANAFADDTLSVARILTQITLGNDGFYNKVISPAKSLNLNLSEATRTQDANNRLAKEIGSVLSAFKMSSEAQKLDNVKRAIQLIDPQIIINGGANIVFTDGTPSAAISRTYIMIPKKANNPKISAQRALNSFSSYKRSAIPSVTVYEYTSAQNISQSSITTRAGSELSWKAPSAAAEITKNKDIVLKKCRQIMGWKCVTSLYRTGDLSANSKESYLYAGIYDLENNPDHPGFANDRRSVNQIKGSTAFYAVVESEQWVLLYGEDSQWNQAGLSFTGLIANEFQKDFIRIKERIALDMNVAVTDIK